MIFLPLSLLLLAAAPSAQSSTILPVEGASWRLAVPLGDLKPTQGFPSRQDRQVRTYRDGRGTMLSVIVENARQPATLASCRNVFDRRKGGTPGPNIRLINEVQSQRGQIAIQEYDFEIDSGGRKTLHHNVHSCRARGTHYIDVHASKMDYRPSDRAALIALVESVAIID